MLYYEKLENKIHEKASLNGRGQFIVISGYIGYEPIHQLAEKLPNVNITVIYGMYGSDGISAPLHNALVDIHRKMSNVKIYYSLKPVHSKIYYKQTDDDICSILMGSANFSVSGLRNDYKEVLSDVNEDSYKDFSKYLEFVRQWCVECTDESIKVKRVLKVPNKTRKEEVLLQKNICRISFLDKNGRVPQKSGLNWCHSKGKVAIGDAYIPIKRDNIMKFPKMFPPKKYVGGKDNDNYSGKKQRENDEVELIWDDGTVMIGLLEGQFKHNGVIYPKQLSSSPHKSILGKYIRERLGVSLNHIITKSDLNKYGRTHIDVSLISEGIYYINFSIK